MKESVLERIFITIQRKRESLKQRIDNFKIVPVKDFLKKFVDKVSYVVKKVVELGSMFVDLVTRFVKKFPDTSVFVAMVIVLYVVMSELPLIGEVLQLLLLIALFVGMPVLIIREYVTGHVMKTVILSNS